MSQISRSASASSRLSSLSARREGWHMVRFDWVKTARQLKALRDDLRNYGLLTDQADKQIAALEATARDGRDQAWSEIQKLDGLIDTLNANIQNGCFDEV